MAQDSFARRGSVASLRVGALAVVAGLAAIAVPHAAIAQQSSAQQGGGQTQAAQPERNADGAMRRNVPKREKKQKPAAIKPETVRPEPVKPEPAKPEPAKPEPAKPESAKPEPIKPEAVTPEPAAKESAGERSENVLTPTFPLRGVGLRAISFGIGFEYAWWAKPKSVTLRSYSGASDGLRILSLPAGEKAKTVADGTKVQWRAIGTMDNDPALVSDADFKLFQEVLPQANDASAMHRYVAADASARWELQYTLATPLADNRAGDDFVPEIAVGFAAAQVGANSASGVTVAALDAKGNEVGTPIAITIGDAKPTTPVLTMSHLNSSGQVEGLAQAMVATVDLSKLGVASVTSLLVRPIRSGDTQLDGKAAGAGAAPAPFKVMLMETAGTPMPQWIVGD